ncbi:hypothetical protein MC885_007974, partial [Smutsia gigantea]
QEGEEPVQLSEDETPQEAVHPEEFVAIADYSSTNETQLNFLRGEKILILRQTTADWWRGEHAGCCVYIPANHLGKQLEECDLEDTWQNKEYFETALGDAGRSAVNNQNHHIILKKKESLKDKVILDVRCGTSIISLFHAHNVQLTAVYAVEASEMAQHTGQLVMQNGFADVTMFQQKVDVLVSEWMGTCLLSEFMIESILYACNVGEGGRGHLAHHGHTAPCALQCRQRLLQQGPLLGHAYKFNLSALKSLAIKEFFSKPKYNHILKPEDGLSEPCTILQLDMRTVHIADLEVRRGMLLPRINNHVPACAGVQMMRGELRFEMRQAGTLSLEASRAWRRASHSCATHWKQVLFMMDEPLAVHAGNVVTGVVVLQRNPVWRRHMSVALSWPVTSRQDPTSQKVRRAAGKLCCCTAPGRRLEKRSFQSEDDSDILLGKLSVQSELCAACRW